MTINLRADAPSQVEQTNPEKLTDEIKKLQDIQQEIQNYKDRIKDLEENEKLFISSNNSRYDACYES